MADKLISVSKADGTLVCLGRYDIAQTQENYPDPLVVTDHGNVDLPAGLKFSVANDSVVTCTHKISAGNIVEV